MNEVSVELLIGGIMWTVIGLVCILKPKAIIRFVLRNSNLVGKTKEKWTKEMESGVVNGKTNHMFGCGLLFLLFLGFGAFGLGISMLVIYIKGV